MYMYSDDMLIDAKNRNGLQQALDGECVGQGQRFRDQQRQISTDGFPERWKDL
jgi:hypothetical protein